MKSIRNIAFGVLLTIGILSLVWHSSCTKNSCGGVTCLNKGVCKGGICDCQHKGIDGANCEIVYRNIYANNYVGNPPNNPDSTYHTDTNNSLVFVPDPDSTDFTKMQVTWKDTDVEVVTLPIVLSSFSSTGATFSVTPTTSYGIAYTGAGSVNGTTASMDLKQVLPNGKIVNLRFYDFYRH